MAESLIGHAESEGGQANPGDQNTDNQHDHRHTRASPSPDTPVAIPADYGY